jgi:DNA-binding LacI/PurR family transcriptional regulator
MKQRVRIADVAKLAGVSPGTVSAVLNDRVGEQIRVSPQTQKRVWDAVQELQYVANPAARSLAGGRNRMLGVFTYEPIFPVEHHNFYYRFLVGIEYEAEQTGYDLVLFTSTGGTDGKRRIYRNDSNRLMLTDGAILLGLKEDKQELQQLLQEGFPFVFIGRRELPQGEISYVAIDYATSTVEVIENMVAHGHRQFVYLGSYEKHHTEPSQDREDGYRLAHEQLGLPLNHEHITFLKPEDLTTDQLQTFLANGVTAFIAEDDALGLALLDSGEQLQKTAPHDFSMAVLGNPLTASDENIPDWTTFLVPRREIGIEAVRLLIHMLAHPDEPGPHRKMLPCTFVPGNTMGVPKTNSSN